MNFTEILRDLSCQLQAVLRKTANEHSLSLTQTYVLFSVPQDGLPMSTLANRIGLDASTMTRIIGKMEQLGLIHREPVLFDRRVSQVKITSTGQTLYLEMSRTLDLAFTSMLNTLTSDDKESMGRHLENLTWLLLRHRTE